MQRFECPLPNLVPERGVLNPQETLQVLDLHDVSQATAAWIAARKVACEAECAAARADAVAEGYREGLAAFKAATEAHTAARSALGTDLVQLLTSCLQEVLGACPKQDVLRACVSSVLENGYEDGDLVIQVAPEDFEDMSYAVAGLPASESAMPKISVESSDILEPGRSVFYAPSDVLTVDTEILTAQLLVALNVPEVLGPIQARLAANDVMDICS